MTYRRQLLGLCALFTLILLNPAIAQNNCGLSISEAWVRAAPPNARVMAGYLGIHNPSSSVVTISEFTSPQFEQIQIHETQDIDGIARMIKLPHLHIEPGQTINLMPGGSHLMLIKPRLALRPEDNVSLTLLSNQALCSDINLPVKK